MYKKCINRLLLTPDRKDYLKGNINTSNEKTLLQMEENIQNNPNFNESINQEARTTTQSMLLSPNKLTTPKTPEMLLSPIHTRKKRQNRSPVQQTRYNLRPRIRGRQ